MFDFIFRTFFDKVKEDAVVEKKFDRKSFAVNCENTCLSSYFSNCRGLNVEERAEHNKELNMHAHK